MTMDLNTVISGFKKLVKKYYNMRLILCGEGDALETYKDEAKNCEHIVFPGWINKSKIKSLMDLSMVGLYPFHNLPDFINSITNKMVEYWSAGLPVLSTIVGYSREYIIKYNLGRIYSEGNVKSFFDNVEWVYNNSNQIKIMRKNARVRYLTDFKSEIVNQKIVELMNDVVNEECIS
jgi:glycosyltransferase involved in cell wall biosynthesis